MRDQVGVESPSLRHQAERCRTTPLEAAAVAEPDLEAVDRRLNYFVEADGQLACGADGDAAAAWLVTRKRRSVDQQHRGVSPRESIRRRRSRGARADDESVEALHATILRPYPPGLCCEAGRRTIARIASAADTPDIRPHSVGLRRFYYVAVLLVTSVGFFLFVLSESTDRWFAWTIQPPLTAAFLGANYWAAFFLAFLSAREPIWARTRITYAVSVVFTSLTLLATLLHLDKFKFDNANGWLWVIVYVTVPPLLVFLLPGQLRLPGGEPPRAAPIDRWLLPIMAVQGAIVLVIGTALIVAPSTSDSLWPWQLTPLTSRAVGAWLLALAAGLAVTLFERDWARIRVAAVTFTAGPLLQFVALARFSDTVNWNSAGIWAYLVFLAGILLLGLYGLPRSFAAARQGMAFARPAPEPD
jgi:hypothetical protein